MTHVLVMGNYICYPFSHNVLRTWQSLLGVLQIWTCRAEGAKQGHSYRTALGLVVLAAALKTVRASYHKQLATYTEQTNGMYLMPFAKACADDWQPILDAN